MVLAPTLTDQKGKAMKDKGLAFEAAKYLERELASGLLHPELAGAINTMLNVANEALNMSVQFEGTSGEAPLLSGKIPEQPEPENQYGGVTYCEPTGSFVARPDRQTWIDNAPQNYLSVLELRVMAAHLSTALDNVTAALRAKGAV